MKKKSITYSDISKQQLQHLKEFYIQKKVNSMSNIELKEFVLEIITHQINDTIGKEEELEAWTEMSSFFGDEFEIIIKEIKQKYQQNENLKDGIEDYQKERTELLEKNNIDNNREDMWDD